MNKLHQLFHKHEYEKIAWYEEYDEYRNVMYSVRVYKCNTCGREIHVDGRNDPFEKAF